MSEVKTFNATSDAVVIKKKKKPAAFSLNSYTPRLRKLINIVGARSKKNHIKFSQIIHLLAVYFKSRRI